MSEYVATLAARALIEARKDAVSAARLLARWAADDLKLYQELTADYLSGAATKAIQKQLKRSQKGAVPFTPARATKRTSKKGDLTEGTLESLLAQIKTEPALDKSRQTKNIRTLAKSYISKRFDETLAMRTKPKR